MKFKYYYFAEEKKCVLTKELEEKPLYSEINKSNKNMIIDVVEKSVNNLYDFFRKNTIELLIQESEEKMEIDDSEIRDLDFYKSDAFVKLIELINAALNECNGTIQSYTESLDKESINSDS